MKVAKSLLVGLIASAGSVAVLAQDPLKADPAHYKLVLENASVRILRVDYAPGAKGNTHSHPDAVIVPLTTAKVRFAMPDGKSEDRDMTAESGMYSPAGTHTNTNLGTTRVDGLVIEFKTAAAGKAVLPTSRPEMAMKVLAEGPRAMTYRTTATPTFEEASGTKHDYDQIVIALSAAQMSLSIEGQPAKTTWARGDAVFIPRGVGHAAKNASGKPVDFIIVAIK